MDFSELWSEAELDAIFKSAVELPFCELYITAYGRGIGGPPDAPVIEAIATHLPKTWYKHLHGTQGNVVVLKLSKPGAATSQSFPGVRQADMAGEILVDR